MVSQIFQGGDRGSRGGRAGFLAASRHASNQFGFCQAPALILQSQFGQRLGAEEGFRQPNQPTGGKLLQPLLGRDRQELNFSSPKLRGPRDPGGAHLLVILPHRPRLGLPVPG
jgi:hypothetical protein